MRTGPPGANAPTGETDVQDHRRLPKRRVAHPVLWSTRMKDADHARILELVLGRMLELVVFSVEGVRERIGRGQLAVN